MGDGTSDAPSLLVWAMATFHATLLVALAVELLHASGLFGNQLAALDTSVGVVAYLYLWAVTWWTNRRMLDSVGLELLAGVVDPTVEALKWGGVTGLLVFLPAFVVIGGFFVASGGVGAIPFLLITGVVGSVVATGVGVVVGVALALFDLLLLRVARAWLPAGATPVDQAEADSQTDIP